VKGIETRSWAAPSNLIGERIGIHAGKAEPTESFGLRELPLGVILGTARLIGCERVETLVADPYGDFTPGRWGWVLGDVEIFETPVPFRGGQGLSRSWAVMMCA
jgi:hypothetical protein